MANRAVSDSFPCGMHWGGHKKKNKKSQTNENSVNFKFYHVKTIFTKLNKKKINKTSEHKPQKMLTIAFDIKYKCPTLTTIEKLCVVSFFFETFYCINNWNTHNSALSRG